MQTCPRPAGENNALHTFPQKLLSQSPASVRVLIPECDGKLRIIELKIRRSAVKVDTHDP